MNETIHPLKLWLLTKKMSQRDFSKKSGIHEVQLSRILNGKGDPDLCTMLNIYESTDHEIDANAFIRFKQGA